MSWNSSDPNKDPWGRDKNRPSGPPDLDALMRQYKNKLKAFFGGKSQSGSTKNGVTQGGSSFGFLGLIVLGIVALWALSGIYIVSPAERAVVLRFGRYLETVGSGPHWIPPFIETQYAVNVQQVSNFAWQADMLTKDENIVSVAVAVQYRIQDARDYLFNVSDPNTSLEQATASALRQVVGHNTLDDLLTVGRGKVRDDVAQQLQHIISSYKAGLIITDVTLQSVKPPEAVTAAFDDAIKAREDEQAFINKADAYANQVKANAEGQVARIMQEAQAYKKEVALVAKANVASYLALVPEYQKNPQLAEFRLYLNTMENILKQSSKVFIDQKGGNPLVYLPLDKITASAPRNLEPQTETTSGSAAASNSSAAASTTEILNTTAMSDLMNRSSYPSRGAN